MDYGRDFDFTRPFFEQFDELLKTVPLLNLIWANNENSDYINLTADSKDCYIVIESSNNENCYYGYWLQKCTDCCDVSFSHECENCYEVQDSYNSYNLVFSDNCIDCRDSAFLDNCVWCENCFGCINLINKKYYILNKEYSKEEYEKYINKIKYDYTNEIKIFKEQLKNLNAASIKKFAQVNDIYNSSGNYMKNAKNCVECFHAYDSEDCKYGEHVWRNAKDLMDVSTVWRDASLVYESINSWISLSNDMFCIISWSSSYISYSFECFNSSNLFGCVWLVNKEYCIFNKQYTKQEYEELVPKIIEHMKRTWERWEFFPISFSPFGYNESVVNEYFPLSRDEAITKWYKRIDKEYPINVPEWIELLKWQDLPENINDVKDDILKKAILCEVSWKPFRIVKPELDFYRKHNLPLPRKHPDVRHLERMQRRWGRQLYLRTCDNCSKQVISVYPADSEFKVYCENCYNKEIY